MTKEKPEKAVALAVLPSKAFGNAIVGTIDERIRAFDQIAANLAGIALNGWDSVQKMKAGCWLADGKGEHPAVFIENHYVMLIKGRLTIEPKWEYMVRKLKETVPGFRFKVLIETDDCAKVWMSDGVDQHEVEYSLSDAKRQGLLGRGENAWTTGSTREMCLKQAVKRCARRIGVGRSSLPWVDVEMALPDDHEAPDAGVAAERAISDAVLVDDVPAVEAGADDEGAAPSRPPATPPDSEGHTPPPEPKKDPLLRLSTMLVKMYGKQPSKVALEKASLIYNEMMKEATGVEHSWNFKSTADIGPVQAQQMVDYLAARKAAPKGRATVAESPTGDTEVPPAPEAQDEPPPAEAPPDASRDLNDDYDDFMVLVKRAKKLFHSDAHPRRFVTEAPPGSGKMWFVDQATFSQVGKTASVKLSDQGEVAMSQQDLQALNRILSADCDTAERGR